MEREIAAGQIISHDYDFGGFPILFVALVVSREGDMLELDYGDSVKPRRQKKSIVELGDLKIQDDLAESNVSFFNHTALEFFKR